MWLVKIMQEGGDSSIPENISELSRTMGNDRDIFLPRFPEMDSPSDDRVPRPARRAVFLRALMDEYSSLRGEGKAHLYDFLG